MNRYDRGFSMFVWFIIVIGIILTFTQIAASTTNGNSVSIGINGVTEMRCVRGYLFTIDSAGTMRQVLDEFGKGAKC